MKAARRLVPVLLAAWLALAVLAVPGSAQHAPAQQAPARVRPAADVDALRRQQSDTPVAVVLEQLTPLAPRPGQELRLSGRVVNASEDTVRDIRVQLWSDPTRIGSRSQLAEVADSDGTLTGLPVDGTTIEVADAMREGQSDRFTITLPLNRLGLDEFGVYGIGVQVTGVSSAGFGTVGSTTTFLPWTPRGGKVKPTRVALLWPLIGSPWREADGVFRDDTLGDALAEGGRLRTLLDSGGSTDLTWAVDPALLESVADMADGYTVRTADGTTRGTHAAEAKQWLADVREQLADSDVLTLPYADPDLVALRRWRLSQDLTLATTTGPSTAADLLGRAVTGDVAWPPGGRVNQSTLEALRVAGIRSVLLDGQSLPADASLPYTPTGRATLPTIGGSLDAGLADTTLSDLLAADTSDPGAALLVRQRILAETAMITAERPQNGRTVLAFPPRRWSPDGAFAGPLLDALRVAPWVQATTSARLLDTEDPDVPRGPLDYGRQARERELSANYLLPVRRLRLDLQRFASALAPRGGDATAAFDLAILRAESSAWRDAPRHGRELRDGVQEDLAQERAKVYIAADRLVTLTSKTGRFPITIANDLDQPVDVMLDLTSRQQTRLTVGEPQVPRIGPERKTTIEVPAEARANGVVVVDAQLRTRDGEPYGDPVSIEVRATEYGTIAYVITGGAFVVLFVAAGLQVGRRAVAARRRARTLEEDA
ncbi:MAG: DUF6049 family protein [Actinomycetes bacterium]